MTAIVLLINVINDIIIHRKNYNAISKNGKYCMLFKTIYNHINNNNANIVLYCKNIRNLCVKIFVDQCKMEKIIELIDIADTKPIIWQIDNKLVFLFFENSISVYQIVEFILNVKSFGNTDGNFPNDDDLLIGINQINVIDYTNKSSNIYKQWKEQRHATTNVRCQH